MRHPRYVGLQIGTLALSLFVNHLSSYVVVLGLFPLIWVLVVAEDRELRDRFGDEYAKYAAKAPWFIPRSF